MRESAHEKYHDTQKLFVTTAYSAKIKSYGSSNINYNFQASSLVWNSRRRDPSFFLSNSSLTESNDLNEPVGKQTRWRNRKVGESIRQGVNWSVCRDSRGEVIARW